MKMIRIFVLLLCLCVTATSYAREIIELPYTQNPKVVWENNEKEYFSEIWDTRVITNVSVPTMHMFKPDPEIATGTSVIVAPGGALYALSITSEGTEVAEWLSSKGITAFVLKYRLVPTGEDGVRETGEVGDKIGETVAPVLPLSIADGLNAVAYVREHAAMLGLDPTKIGFMGFSAGGSVAMGVALNYTAENRPDFVVPVYPWMNVLAEYEVPADAPPLLVICAADDPLLLAPESVALFSEWNDRGISSAMHMYSQGGHGFGMRRQGLPSDNWIARFYEWAQAEGLIPTPSTRHENLHKKGF